MGRVPFSAATADVVRSVTLDGNGVLSVDFDDIRLSLNNTSTSCGSSSLLSQLTSTAFQFEDVERVRFSINGSCSVFFNWLHRECMEFTRDGATVAGSTEDFASRSGCTPGTAELPDGEWFGYVGDVTATDLTFDLTCWFSGPAAEQAAAEDGQESPPPNDYYVRNVNATVRTVPAAAGAEVEWLPNTGDPTTATTVDYVTWLAEQANFATSNPVCGSPSPTKWSLSSKSNTCLDPAPAGLRSGHESRFALRPPPNRSHRRKF